MRWLYALPMALGAVAAVVACGLDAGGGADPSLDASTDDALGNDVTLTDAPSEADPADSNIEEAAVADAIADVVQLLDAGSDAGDAGDAGPPVVTVGKPVDAVITSKQQDATLTVPATKAGSLLLVGVSAATDATQVADVSDGNGVKFVPAATRAHKTGCGTTEVWYLRNAPANVTSVKVSLNAKDEAAVWYLEVGSVLADAGVDEAGTFANSANAATAQAPKVAVAALPGIIFDVTRSCNALGPLKNVSPFTALTPHDPAAAAWFSPPGTGVHGALYDNDGGYVSTGTSFH